MFTIKTKRYPYVLLIVSLLIFTTIFTTLNRKTILHYSKILKDELEAHENERIIGIYSKGTTVSFDTLFNFKHIILRINTDKTFQVDDSILKNISDAENLLLTIEFRGNKYFTNIKNNPLEQILNGLYDKKIELIGQAIFRRNKNIYVRFNPEMEVPVYSFPWQNKSGKQYIEAYRCLVTKFKNLNSDLKFVWGPAGFMGLEEYYPGEDVVDVISITLKSETERMFTRYPTYIDLKDEIHKKNHRLRFFNHPVMILGSKNANDKAMIFDLVSSEIDTIIKYQNVAYNKSLWSKKINSEVNIEFIMGVYDPYNNLTLDPVISAEHIFVDFGQVQTGELKRLLQEIFSRNHDAILTVEPWRDISGIADSTILYNILSGKYNSTIQRIFTDISDNTRTVYLRFAHEMEIPITRYAWQSQDPLVYIRAFRYFMTYTQSLPSNVKRIWGPAGDRASMDFYPGNDVVDYVSFAVYGLPDKNITDHERQASFSKIFYNKLWRFRQINKPIFITEFGVKGPEDYQNRWLEDAAKTLNENSRVIGINYFNMSDTPGAWGEIEEPDWSITSSSLHRFMKILERDKQ